MPTLEPRTPGFATIRQLVTRLDLATDEANRVSVDDEDVPTWQRQVVWSEEEMGLLALSVIRNFPIGLMILWQKPTGIRVPIDGRQRLSAIKAFAAGEVAIPDLPMVPEQFRNTKYRLVPSDEEEGFTQLPLADREIFDSYETKLIQYDNIPEQVAMEIFVMLQGGKSLTKTEIRAALGGKLCDFVTELTGHGGARRHPFFIELSRNLKNRRKAHRNVCDVLLHEHLYPGQDKHWTSLEKMYREKTTNLSASDRAGFSTTLRRFLRATTTQPAGVRRLMPQLRSVFFILDAFRVWRAVDEGYDLARGTSFGAALTEFEVQRQAHPDDLPWVRYTNELSNAGYAKNRMDSRFGILMTFMLQFLDGATPKQRDRRNFTDAQKLAIWERADHQCEWERNGERCTEEFVDFREADADHIVKWSQNGPTTVANGRLLCQRHNRSRR
jgi:hypothetical protein